MEDWGLGIGDEEWGMEIDRDLLSEEVFFMVDLRWLLIA